MFQQTLCNKDNMWLLCQCSIHILMLLGCYVLCIGCYVDIIRCKLINGDAGSCKLLMQVWVLLIVANEH